MLSTSRLLRNSLRIRHILCRQVLLQNGDGGGEMQRGEGLEGKRPGRVRYSPRAKRRSFRAVPDGERHICRLAIACRWQWPDSDAFDIFRKPLEPDGQDSVFRTVVLNGGRRTPKYCVPPHPRSGLRRRIHYAGHTAGHAPWLRHKRPDRQDGSKRRLRGAGQESPVRQ